MRAEAVGPAMICLLDSELGKGQPPSCSYSGNYVEPPFKSISLRVINQRRNAVPLLICPERYLI